MAKRNAQMHQQSRVVGGEVALGFTPVGVALDIRDAGIAIRDRDAVGFGLAGVGFIPGVGDAFKAIGKGVRKLLGGGRKSLDELKGLDVLSDDEAASIWGGAKHGHHSDPKFLGGDKKQLLTELDEDLHRELHNDLNDYLDSILDSYGNSMRPKRGNSGAKIRGNFSRQERLEATADFYKQNYDKYTEAADDFFNQHPNLK